VFGGGGLETKTLEIFDHEERSQSFKKLKTCAEWWKVNLMRVSMNQGWRHFCLRICDDTHMKLNVFLPPSENVWTTNNLQKDTKYIFRAKAENEYGFSAYSNNSVEYEFQSYTAIVWSILPIIGIIGTSGFSIMMIYGKSPGVR